MNISPRRLVCSKATKLERGVRQAQRGHKWGEDRRKKIRGYMWMETIWVVCLAVAASIRFVCPLTGRTPQWYYALYRCHGHTRSYTHSGPRSSCPGSSPGRTAWSAQRETSQVTPVGSKRHIFHMLKRTLLHFTNELNAFLLEGPQSHKMSLQNLGKKTLFWLEQQ